jgi:hypothetical protein
MALVYGGKGKGVPGVAPRSPAMCSVALQACNLVLFRTTCSMHKRIPIV